MRREANMARWLLGLLLGIALGSTAHGDVAHQPLEEMRVRATTANLELALPTEYGRLVAVAVRAEVHHLYFEGPDGTIRIVLIGSKGSVQRARSELQLLTPEVFVVKRGEAG
jgi:hypothetical protein